MLEVNPMRFLFALLVVLLLLAGCAPATPTASPNTVDPLTAEYWSEISGRHVRLVDGVYQAPQGEDDLFVLLVEPTAAGDLNGDGLEDLAVVLVSTLRSKCQYELAVLLQDDTGYTHAASALLGNQVDLKWLVVDQGEVVGRFVYMETGGSCCGLSQPVEVERRFRFEEGRLVQLP
jgi:hypothetical protein